MKRIMTIAAMSASFALFADTLTWNGTASDRWDASIPCWLNASGLSVLWSSTCVAAFGDAGSQVVSLPAGENAEVTATGLAFTSATEVEINADGEGGVPTQHSLNHGIALLSPNGTAAAVIDAGAAAAAGGKIVTDLTDLVFDTNTGCVSGERTADAAPTKFLPAESKKVGKVVTYWKNRSLADIKSMRAIVTARRGANRSGESIARTLYFSNDGTTATVQFQGHEATQPTKNYTYRFCVMVEFKQVGPDITAQITSVRHVSNSLSAFEADRFPIAGDATMAVIDDDLNTDGGYGVRAIMAGEAKTNGGKGVTIKAAGYTQEYTGVLSKANSTSGGTPGPFTYWKNLKLSDVEYFTANTFSPPGTTWKKSRSYYPEWSSDGNSLIVLFERYNTVSMSTYNYCTVIRVRFTQVGDDVTAEWLGAGYSICTGVSSEGLTDDHVGVLPIPSAVHTGSHYGVKDIVPHLRPKVTVRGQLDVNGGVKLSGNGTLQVASAAVQGQVISGVGDVRYDRHPVDREGEYQGILGDTVNTYTGDTVVDGATMVITDQYAIPAGGTLIATNGANVVVKTGNKILAGGNMTVFVYPNSVVRHVDEDSATRNFNETDVFNIYGGEFAITNSLQYMTELTLKDGGRVTSGARNDGFRLGEKPTFPRIFSTGSGTNEIACRVFHYRSTAAAHEYATINTKAPLLFSGEWSTCVSPTSPDAAGRQGSWIRKIGLSKMIYGKTCVNKTDANANTATVEVVEGTFRTENTLAFHWRNALMLRAGAAFEVADGVNVTNKALTVAAAEAGTATTATLDFGKGASYTLGSARDFVVASGTKLLLTGDVGSESLRIGTSKCLTAAQRSSIKCLVGGVEKRVSQDDRGYVYHQGGTLLIVR